MITALAAVLLACSASAAAPAPAAVPGAKPGAAPAVAASTAAAAAVSTITVSSLYTGDRYRDPFLPPSVGGGPARKRETPAAGRAAVDIHALQLRGIMKDSKADFALFSADDGSTLVLRAGRLYDDRGKAVPGITGRIQIKQKRAQLVTADKDVQIYSLGETPDEADKK